MTVAVQQLRYVYRGPFHQADIIPIPFDFKEKEHVKAALGMQPLEINVDYYISGSNLIINIEVPASNTLTVYRKTDMEQDSDYPQSSAFDSDKIEDALDKLTMQNQEQEDALSRCLQQSINTDPDAPPVSIGEIIPGRAVKWNDEGNALVCTDYDLDALAAEANAAVERANEASNIAINAANEAKQATSDAAQAARDVAQASSTILGVAETARKYAIGTIEECPEGSAKWWAQQAAQTVTGEYYTKNEVDAIVAAKADSFTPAGPLEFVTEGGVKKLKINDTTMSETYATNEAVDEIADTKQDTLIPGIGVSIGADGKTISVDVSSVAYTKAQTNALLAGKQDALTPGQYISLNDGNINVAADVLIQGFTAAQWAEKTSEEKAAIKLAVVYES